MYSLHITDIAEKEILNTINYISDVLKAPIAANNLLDEVEKYEKILEDTPDIFSFVPDEYLRTRGIKYVMVKKYMMFFTVDEGEHKVDVIRFLYGRRDWKNILGKSNTKRDGR
jgi:plasmid stabilization system protein ParE